MQRLNWTIFGYIIIFLLRSRNCLIKCNKSVLCVLPTCTFLFRMSQLVVRSFRDDLHSLLKFKKYENWYLPVYLSRTGADDTPLKQAPPTQAHTEQPQAPSTNVALFIYMLLFPYRRLVIWRMTVLNWQPEAENVLPNQKTVWKRRQRAEH